MPLLSLINSRHRMLPFISLWETTGAAETITLPTPTNYVVDWGDGTITTNTNNHEYANIGQYEIKIKGEINDFAFSGLGDGDKLLNISSFGGFTAINGGLWGCDNLDITAIDIPIISNLDRFFTFDKSLVFNISVSDWDVSNITTMFNCFSGVTNFNQPLNNWDVSNVTNMGFAFKDTPVFKQPLNNWNVSNVNSLDSMFQNSGFDGNIDNWDVSNVTNMNALFWNADSFNQPLNSWVTSSLTNINGIFVFNSGFNMPLNNWDTSQVTTMFNAFNGATAFDQDISAWDFSSVTNIASFMSGKSAANYSTTNMDALYNKLDNAVGGLVFANMTNLNIQFGTINYTSAGATARASLVSKGFVIASGIEV